MDLITYFKTHKLLSKGADNKKMAKNKLTTYYLALRPHTMNTAGVNLCRFSTKECRSSCLNGSGFGNMASAQAGRLRKTDFFVSHRTAFLEQLWRELGQLNEKHRRVAVRLNTFSDVDWEFEFTRMGKTLESFKHIIFYDYTKSHIKAMFNMVENYHLTLSYSGHNWKHCEKALEMGVNVAVVFKNKIPKVWNGWRVVDGTKTDERFLDKKGVIVGLIYKVAKGMSQPPDKFVVDGADKKEAKMQPAHA
jgi:hypothetical protein